MGVNCSLVDRCGIVVGCCGSLWDRCGSLWIVVGRCGSLWVVVGRCGSFRVLVTTWETVSCSRWHNTKTKGARVTVLWGTVFIIKNSDRTQYFPIFQYKLHSFNIRDDQSTRGLLAKPSCKPLKKFPKSPIPPAGSYLCSASCGECLNKHK